MDDQNTLAIVTAIGDMRTDVATRFGELKESVAKDIGAVNTTVAGFHADLNARLKAVEDDTKSQKKWGRVNIALMPAYAFLHGIASHLGFKV